jgi:hypothetical protein
MVTRLRTDHLPGRRTDELAGHCAGPASHTEWLSSLRRGDTVRVRNGALTMPPAMVTNDSPCYVFVGKLKFWRRHGWQVKKGAAYRQALRLVRNAEELQ